MTLASHESDLAAFAERLRFVRTTVWGATLEDINARIMKVMETFCQTGETVDGQMVVGLLEFQQKILAMIEAETAEIQ